MKVVYKVLIITLVSVTLLVAGFFTFYLIVVNGSKLDENKLNLSECNIQIYDSNLTSVAFLSSHNTREYTTEKDIPPMVRQAFVSIEDKRFYEHNGIDTLRLIKALAKNAVNFSFKEGASTISQQLIKNTHLSNEKTIKRKMKEIHLTRKLEKIYNKEEILEMYLNTIYFGHSCFGIQNASKYYFGKDACDLELNEGAMLAGLLKSPNNYSPFKNKDKCLQRRNLVLSMMKEQGVITEEDYDTQSATPLPTTPKIENELKSYTSQIFSELDEICEIYRIKSLNACKIYTYLDTELQSYIENIANEESIKEFDKSVIVVENNGCGIKAFYSSIGMAKRLPASIIKPLFVYAPAMNEGYLSPASLILDEQVDYNGYKPENLTGEHYGYVSVKNSIAKSINIPAVKVLNSFGIERASVYLEKMNLPVDNQDKTLAMALGGMKEGYNLMSLVGGYSTFANEGFFTQPKFIKEIVDESGKTIYKNPQEKTSVYSKETAYLMNDMLKYTAKEGTARKLKSCGFDICAKTGTNGTKNGNADAYTLAYSTLHSLGVWLGKADGSLSNLLGSREPCEIVNQLQEHLYSNNYPPPFIQPENIVSYKLDKIAYDESQRLVLADDNAPPIYTFYSLFNKEFAPFEKSNRFTKPKLDRLDIYFKDDKVTINIKGAKNIYCIVKRKEDEKQTIVYEGLIKTQIDDYQLKKNKSYVYSVTPYIKVMDKIIYGDEQFLPEVKTQETQKEIINEKQEITKKSWWEDD